MSLAFPNLSWWLWSGKTRDAKLPSPRGSCSGNSSSEFDGMELDMVKFPVINLDSDSTRRRRRRTSRKWNGQDDGKIDKDLDVVLVSSESESESDASDWSIGWSEPHASGFLSEDEIDAGFGILVRCYGRGKQDGSKDTSDNNGNVPQLYSADNKNYMGQWLSSLQES